MQDFDSLVMGLAEFFYQDSKYPHPDLLRLSCNKLALKMTATSYPRTVEGFFTLLEKPLCDWCPFDIPQEFDKEFGLIYDGELSEEASDYFYEQLLDEEQILNSSTKNQQIALENFQFRKLLNSLQNAYEEDAEAAQQEYVLLRRFLIDNPYATEEKIREAFTKTIYIRSSEVGELYEDCEQDRTYWCCDRCGPLINKNGQLRGIKPSVCNDHRQNLNKVCNIAWERGLRQIKRGIHWRVCLPGIPEINLFESLKQLQQEHSKYLHAVNLWSGIDRYDLQLRFSDDSVWAIDVKDYRSPYALARNITGIYGEGSLRYDKSFYVIPQHRLRNRKDYIDILREEAKQLPKSVQIISEIAFEELVIDKISSLSKTKSQNK